MVTKESRPPLLTAMILMSLVDGRVAIDEVTRIQWIYGKVADDPIEEHDVRAAIAEVRASGLTIDTHLKSVAEELGDGDKRQLLQAAFAIASADGRVVDEEDQLLRRIAKGLGITPEAYRAMLSHMGVARGL